MEQSPTGTLNITDAKKIAKGAFYAGGGQAIVFILQAVINVDFGKYTGLIGAVASVLMLIINKLLAGTPETQNPML